MSRALLLSPDDQAVSAITGVLEEMAVSCERPLDGASAALKLNSHSFDLVLVDCENLPAAKLIFDVCRRGKGGNTPVPIAIVDGRAGLPTAFRLGAELILTKPVSKDHVRSTIRTAVGRVRKEDTVPSPPDAADSQKVPDTTVELAVAAAATALNGPSLSAPVLPAPALPAPALTAPEPEMSAPTMSALASPAPDAMAPQPAAAAENDLISALESGAAPQMSAAVKEAPALPVRPAPVTVPPRIQKRLAEVLPGLKPEPEEKLSADPVLSEIDKVETKIVVPKAAASFPARRAPAKKGGGPVLLLFLMLAGGSFYAAWMYVPGFSALVGPQIERVLALTGQKTQPSAKSQPKTPAPTAAQNAATTAPTAPVPQPATPLNQTPGNNESAPVSTAAAALPGAGANQASATGSKVASAPATAPTKETAEESADASKSGPSITLEKPPVMDKNVVILSSKGAEKRLAHKVSPTYPKEAKAAGLTGTVVLKTLVSDTGKVTDASLVDGNPILAAAAIQAVKQWRYRPYERGGKNLAFQTVVMLDLHP
jgi:protein TonB